MVSGNVVSGVFREIDKARLDQLLSGARSVVYNDLTNDLSLVYPLLAQRRDQVIQSYDKLYESIRVAEEFAKQRGVFHNMILPLKQILDRPQNSNVVLDLLLEALVTQLAHMLKPFHEAHEFLLLQTKLYDIYTRIQTQSNQEISLALTGLSKIVTTCSETLYSFILDDIELLHKNVETYGGLFRSPATTGRPPEYPYDASTYASSSSDGSTTAPSDSLSDTSTPRSLSSPFISPRGTLILSDTSGGTSYDPDDNSPATRLATSPDMPKLELPQMPPVSRVRPTRVVPSPPPKNDQTSPIHTPRNPPPATSTGGISSSSSSTGTPQVPPSLTPGSTIRTHYVRLR